MTEPFSNFSDPLNTTAQCLALQVLMKVNKPAAVLSNESSLTVVEGLGLERTHEVYCSTQA